MDCFKILSTAKPEQQYLIVYKPLKDYFLFSSAWSFERACAALSVHAELCIMQPISSVLIQSNMLSGFKWTFQCHYILKAYPEIYYVNAPLLKCPLYSLLFPCFQT